MKLTYMDIKDIAIGRTNRDKKLNGISNPIWLVSVIMLVLLFASLFTLAFLDSDDNDNVKLTYTSDDGKEIVFEDNYATFDNQRYILETDDADKDESQSLKMACAVVALVAFGVISFSLLYYYLVIITKKRDELIQYYMDNGELPQGDD